VSEQDTPGRAAVRRKAVLVTNIPTPYRIPLFDELGRQLLARQVDLTVVFGAGGYARRRWNVDLGGAVFRHHVLRPRRLAFGAGESPSFTYPGLLSLLRREKPDIIIAVGFSLASLKVWLASVLFGMRYIIWSGAIAEDTAPSRFRLWQRRLLIGRAVAYISYGSLARDYLVQLGAARERVHIAINTVDTEFFRRETDRSKVAGTVRQVLFIGDLTSRKRPDLVLDAFALVARQRPDVALVLVGDGPLRGKLEETAAKYGVADRVRFEGFRQRDQIPRYLGEAWCFVFPTDFDVWGLVLVEAMAAALPCISSVRAGATRDLIEEGVTGLAADFHDPAAVAAKILFLLDNADRATQMGEAARDFIRARANLAISAAGAATAIDLALGGDAPSGRTVNI
jgi:glycosyltransferase involved in cell wall biosynthesis